jgi:hypothetical protein
LLSISTTVSAHPVELVVETIRGINVKIIISIPTQTPNQELTLRVKIALDKNKVPMASFHNVERINLVWDMNPIAYYSLSLQI